LSSYCAIIAKPFIGSLKANFDKKEKVEGKQLDGMDYDLLRWFINRVEPDLIIDLMVFRGSEGKG
jgi:hypothetical protein